MTKSQHPDGMESHQEILHPGSRALFRYWESIRGEQAAPSRRDINLRSIGNYVPSLYIMESAADRRSMIYRLAGSSICNLFKRQLTGAPAFKDWPHFERETAQRLLEGVVASLQPCAIRFRLSTPQGHRIGTELIALPILAKTPGIVHVFGSIMTFSDIPGMGYDRISGVELSSARVIWTVPVPGDQIAANLKQNRMQPQLTVIDGGRRQR